MREGEIARLLAREGEERGNDDRKLDSTGADSVLYSWRWGEKRRGLLRLFMRKGGREGQEVAQRRGERFVGALRAGCLDP